MFKIPTIHGYIDRRILVNYSADPEAVQKILPYPFRPKPYKDRAIVGICLIRLKHIKPKGFYNFMGVNSENGAHRIAVEWDDNGLTKSGVYIPRRDTSLILNTIVGGRIFPGEHHQAKFNVHEVLQDYNVAFKSSDGTEVSVNASVTHSFSEKSIFDTIEDASEFLKQGELGYSPYGIKFQGLRLHTYKWEVQPLKVHKVKSSFFENKEIFPEGSVRFDNALLMTNIEHEWHSVKGTTR